MTGCSFTFTHGDVDVSFSIMREAAHWLINTGRGMWSPDEFTRQTLINPADEFIVLWNGDESVATMILSFVDKLFWPDIPLGKSGFVHKLSVRRKYAGTGAAAALIDYVSGFCQEKGVFELRLDCDPHRKGLCSFYENAGFELLEVKKMQTKRLGAIDLAMYMKTLTN